jgi:hypothetical protein
LHEKIGKIFVLNDKKSLDIYNILNTTFDSDNLTSNNSNNIFLPKINKEIDLLQIKIDENRAIFKNIAKYIEEYK